MADYYWDGQIDYLRRTRGLYYNDDYLAFLVRDVWKLHEPVSMADFGCGFGYMGLQLLPLLPEGSRYIGIDKGKELLARARAIFAELPFEVDFIEADLEAPGPVPQLERRYDIALSHAFLLHMPEPLKALRTMIDSVADGGRIICFEPHWIGNMANYGFGDVEQSALVRLGALQKLYEADRSRTGKNGNIGLQLPMLLSQLGVRNVECRVSDKVNFLDACMDRTERERLYASLAEEGLGQSPGDAAEVIGRLTSRGLTDQEAREQYEAELLFSQVFDESFRLTYAPNMKISFGTVAR